MFHVNAFGFPPTEPSSFTRCALVFNDSNMDCVVLHPHRVFLSVSRAYYGNINFFGGPSSTAVKASAKLKQLEEENEDAMFVIVSDVWLDSVEVLEKIQTMFSGPVLLLGVIVCAPKSANTNNMVKCFHHF